MDPQSQLVETLRAAGEENALEERDKLISLYKEEKGLSLNFFHQNSKLENLVEQNAILEQQVQRFKEREEHLKIVMKEFILD